VAESVIGWDVGGAHLKAARLDAGGSIESVVQTACPLWQGMPRLASALDEALPAVGAAPLHAVTMTGEMVDLFANRRQGVAGLLGRLRRRLGPVALRVYAGPAGFVDPDRVAGAEAEVASANWHASATLVARQVDAALYVDVGSTTVDLAPVAGGRVLTRGADDGGRLACGELLYTGIVRTPLMAIAREAPWAGDWVPLMAEYFATAADVYRLTGELPEGADQHPTADGREKTPVASARRLARMVGRDVESAPLAAWQDLAAWMARAQRRSLEDACDRILSRGDLPADAPLVGAGVGRFLLPALAARMSRPYRTFGDLVAARSEIRDRVSDCAPAVAVGWLAAGEAIG
jgi:probable H4MPT-linked C1 transfer pathway protein